MRCEKLAGEVSIEATYIIAPMQVFEFVAILTATLFSGAAIYVNLVEHPARVECGTGLAATVFGPSYRRGAVMQSILALAATIAGIGAWFMGARLAWLLGASLIFRKRLVNRSS